jgi:hypothetical protein
LKHDKTVQQIKELANIFNKDVILQQKNIGIQAKDFPKVLILWSLINDIHNKYIMTKLKLDKTKINLDTKDKELNNIIAKKKREIPNNQDRNVFLADKAKSRFNLGKKLKEYNILKDQYKILYTKIN